MIDDLEHDLREATKVSNSTKTDILYPKSKQLFKAIQSISDDTLKQISFYSIQIGKIYKDSESSRNTSGMINFVERFISRCKKNHNHKRN